MIEYLEWEKSYGQKVEQLQGRINEGLPTPFWDNRPRVGLQSEIYLQAFRDLAGDRQIGGMGTILSIPFTAIDRWAARNGFDDPESFASLHRILKRVDGAWLSMMNEKQSAGSGKGKSTTPRTTKRAPRPRRGRRR